MWCERMVDNMPSIDNIVNDESWCNEWISSFSQNLLNIDFSLFYLLLLGNKRKGKKSYESCYSRWHRDTFLLWIQGTMSGYAHILSIVKMVVDMWRKMILNHWINTRLIRENDWNCFRWRHWDSRMDFLQMLEHQERHLYWCAFKNCKNLVFIQVISEPRINWRSRI